MMTPGRSAAVLLVLLIFLASFAWFRPAALGGSANYIIVSGDSMEPTYHDGDLVVLRKAPGYNTGDIVAYPMKGYFESGWLVIHRVIGSDPEGFITQGDNRDRADPWRATGSDIRGAAWVHVPGAGNYLASLRVPWHLGLLAAGIFLVGGLHTTEIHRKRRRHRMNEQLGKLETWLAARGELGKNQPVLMALAISAGAVAVAFLLLGLVAFTRASGTTSQVSQPTYSETGSYDYAIVMEPSTLYPDGILRPQPETEAATSGSEDTPPSPPPAFTSLAREAQLTFHYELAAEAPAELNGTVAADLVIHPAGGEWSRKAPLLAAESFEGLAFSKPMTIDLASVGALITRIEEETGLSASTYEIDVVTHVDASGTRDGEPLETSFESTFTLDYTRTLITPPSTLSTTAQATTTQTVTTAKSLALGVWSPSVATARVLTVVGFMAALGALVVSGGYLALGLWTDEQARVRARYGSRLVDVDAPEAGRDKDAIRVASIRDLARLAERFGSVILHVPFPTGHRYFVRDGDDTYEYIVGAVPEAKPVRRTRATSTRKA